ncbi:hypothetical protein [Saccharibacillus sacchari]|uniref:Uncharacterized protein n=1 Tax=Saccharibacillus sacchari TaxID=456493 RepID=A0ACC6PI91_9BACL
MNIKAQIERINLIDYMRAGRLESLVEAFRIKSSIDELKSEADAVWRNGEIT